MLSFLDNLSPAEKAIPRYRAVFTEIHWLAAETVLMQTLCCAIVCYAMLC